MKKPLFLIYLILAFYTNLKAQNDIFSFDRLLSFCQLPHEFYQAYRVDIYRVDENDTIAIESVFRDTSSEFIVDSLDYKLISSNISISNFDIYKQKQLTVYKYEKQLKNNAIKLLGRFEIDDLYPYLKDIKIKNDYAKSEFLLTTTDNQKYQIIYSYELDLKNKCHIINELIIFKSDKTKPRKYLYHVWIR